MQKTWCSVCGDCCMWYRRSSERLHLQKFCLLLFLSRFVSSERVQLLHVLHLMSAVTGLSLRRWDFWLSLKMHDFMERKNKIILHWWILRCGLISGPHLDCVWMITQHLCPRRVFWGSEPHRVRCLAPILNRKESARCCCAVRLQAGSLLQQFLLHGLVFSRIYFRPKRVLIGQNLGESRPANAGNHTLAWIPILFPLVRSTLEITLSLQKKIFQLGLSVYPCVIWLCCVKISLWIHDATCDLQSLQHANSKLIFAGILFPFDDFFHFHLNNTLFQLLISGECWGKQTRKHWDFFDQVGSTLHSKWMLLERSSHVNICKTSHSEEAVWTRM